MVHSCSATNIGISPSTVLRWGKSALRKNKSGRYIARKSDRLLRVLLVPTTEGPREIALPDSRQATILAEYWDSIQKYLETEDASGLDKFRGQVLTDASGAKISLVTDLNELNRLGSAGVLSFESLYSRTT